MACGGRRGRQRRGGGRRRHVGEARRAADGRTDAGTRRDRGDQKITSAAESADVRAIFLTTFDLDEYVFGALRAGASGFLLKDTLPEDLITAIRVVAAGEALLAPSVTRRLISEFARTPALGLRGGRAAARAGGGGGGGGGGRRGGVTDLLTDRECEVIRLVAAGMSNGEIADHNCAFHRPRRRRTSPTCSPSWTHGTAFNSSSSPTRQAWSRRRSPARQHCAVAERPRGPALL